MEFIRKLIWSSSKLVAFYAIRFKSSLCGSSLFTLFRVTHISLLSSDKPSPERQISIMNIDLPKRVGIRRLSSAIRVSHHLSNVNKISFTDRVPLTLPATQATAISPSVLFCLLN